MPTVDDATYSPFACQAMAPSAAGTARLQQLVDCDEAALAAEAADYVSPLPDAAANITSAPGLSATKGQVPVATGGGGSGAGGGAFAAASAPSSKQGTKRKLIPLKQVVRHSYEYHGLNDLFYFCITALAVTMVLYWHWGETTATFKATVQRSFQGYGNPDWQNQQLINVDTMYDAVEYSMGWLEFWLQRADNIDWSNETVRVGEFGDLKYVRMLVNIDRNCAPSLTPNMECYEDDDLTKALQNNSTSCGDHPCSNLLQWAGWQRLGKLRGRDAADAGTAKANQWWSYGIIAPKWYGDSSKRDHFIGRMYNITRNTNINYNNCDWANYTCGDMGPDGPKCATSGPQVPFSSWWSSTVMCKSNATKDQFPLGTRAVKRGQRYFARHPNATDVPKPDGIGTVLDLKPFLSKFAYSISLDVLAANAVHGKADNSQGDSDADRALFTMTLQRSAQVKDKPDRILWQITSTVPVRTKLYSQYADRVRIGFEVLLYICLLCILALQVRQVYVCWMQHNSFKPWLGHFWNCFEALSNLTLLAWVIYYWVLFTQLGRHDWRYDEWDVDGPLANTQLDSIMGWSSTYSAWLYMGIVVDLFFCMRLARYMRIHVGLKAFYQVFLIAAREFLDFAVFLFYILVLLGSAVFAFFQLTGGNYQFLRFPDGLSLMTRLTFGFLSYDEFQSQALGVGAAVSAVTLLFWLAVLLLVVYTQNIILAIVAEAYEEAKAKLGTAETSFLMLVLMRILFTALFVVYRIRMFFRDCYYACTGWTGSSARLPSFAKSDTLKSSAGAFASTGYDHGPDGGPGSAAGAASAGHAAGHTSSNNGYAPWSGSSQWGGEVPDENIIPLAPTTSRAVLPADVERGLSGESFPNSSHINLLGSGRTSSQYAPTQEGPAAASAGADVAEVATADRAASHGPLGFDGITSRSLTNSASRARLGRSPPQTLRQRLSRVWHDVILGETHLLRMYKDLAPGQKEDVWVRSWKEKYWRPWCVARTAPLRCLVNLYQDFASYKLKEECAWLANSEAKRVMASAWRGNSPQSASSVRQPSCSSSLEDCGSVATSEGSAQDADSSMALLTFPALLSETWVDEDELAHLFLVTSQMSSVLKIWFPPFYKLSKTEVEYLVKAISVVYGVDEDLVLQQQPGARVLAGSDAASAQLSGPLPSTISSQMRDAQLGQQNARRGGGFINSLNMKRRDGTAEQTRQMTWLLHANKRLEEATLRNAGHLQNANNRLERYANTQEDFQRKQQRTNSQLLRGMETLTQLVQAQQPMSPTAGGAGAAAAAMDGASSGVLAGQGGSAGALSAVRRLTASTTKVLSSRTVRTKSNASATGTEGGANLMRAMSDLSSPASPTAGDAVGEEGGCLEGFAGSDSGLVLSLKEQLEQQHKTLQLQQELLQQVLTRLPPAQ